MVPVTVSGVTVFLYLALISFFYYWSQGFVMDSAQYSLLKMTPVGMLSIHCFLVGGKVGLSGKERVFTAIALCAGAIGDYIIGHDHKGLAKGAIAFGIGHVFYLLTFLNRIKTVNKICAAVVLMCTTVVAWTTVIPHFPVEPLRYGVMSMYACLLSTCLIMSSSLYFSGGQRQAPKSFDNLLLFLGFMLFYISDSLIAINFMRHTIPHAHKLILSTYFTAQYLILWSICSSHKTVSPRKTQRARARAAARASNVSPKASRSVSPKKSASPRKSRSASPRGSPKVSKRATGASAKKD